MLVVAIFSLLLALAMPAIARARAHLARTTCLANLRALDDAKARWALDNQQPTNVVPTDADLFGWNGQLRKKPTCPVGGEYILGPVGSRTECSRAEHRP